MGACTILTWGSLIDEQDEYFVTSNQPAHLVHQCHHLIVCTSPSWGKIFHLLLLKQFYIHILSNSCWWSMVVGEPLVSFVNVSNFACTDFMSSPERNFSFFILGGGCWPESHLDAHEGDSPFWAFSYIYSCPAHLFLGKRYCFSILSHSFCCRWVAIIPLIYSGEMLPMQSWILLCTQVCCCHAFMTNGSKTQQSMHFHQLVPCSFLVVMQHCVYRLEVDWRNDSFITYTTIKLNQLCLLWVYQSSNLCVISQKCEFCVTHNASV